MHVIGVCGPVCGVLVGERTITAEVVMAGTAPD
jgi:hypothetical protein